MRNYKKYRSTIISLFTSFLASEIEKRDLIYKLTEIDEELRENPKTLKGLWFKFFKDDTGATTIHDLYCNIDSRVNQSYVFEQMQIAVYNPKGLQIYYS